MLIILSPAKTLDFSTPPVTAEHSIPDLLEESRALVDVLRRYSALDLAELMKLSIKLAELNFERYQRWHLPFSSSNAKQAILAMKGEVYTGLDAESLRSGDFKFAQKHLRILSGLYGVLRPLDLMQPYRLEMGTRLKTSRGATLYDFWGDGITKALNRALEGMKRGTLINLASAEYFKSVRPGELKVDILTPQFKEAKGGTYKMIGVHAKKARGLMARYIIRNRLTDIEKIKAFDAEGYAFSEPLSTEWNWVFTRG